MVHHWLNWLNWLKADGYDKGYDKGEAGGLEKGKAIGIEKGKAIERKKGEARLVELNEKIVINSNKAGLSTETISTLTGLTPAQINDILKRQAH